MKKRFILAVLAATLLTGCSFGSTPSPMTDDSNDSATSDSSTDVAVVDEKEGLYPWGIKSYEADPDFELDEAKLAKSREYNKEGFEGDVTEMVDFSASVELEGRVTVTRSMTEDRYIYTIDVDGQEIDSVYLYVEPEEDIYIQVADMTGDGRDEVLAVAYTPTTALLNIMDFYVYSRKNGSEKWFDYITYFIDACDYNGNVFGAFDREHKMGKLLDAFLTEDGLLLINDTGSKDDEGVYYPVINRVLIGVK